MSFSEMKRGIHGRDLHGDVLDQLQEILVLGHEIGFAAQFHQHADLALHVDIGTDRALVGRPR